MLLDAAGWHPGPDGVRVRDGKRLSLLLVYGLGSQIRSYHLRRRCNRCIARSESRSSSKASTTRRSMPRPQSGGILNGGKFDLAMYAWVSGSDPDDSSQWTCGMIPPAGNNVTRYCSPEMEAAQRLALSTFDQATSQARIRADRAAAAAGCAGRIHLLSVACVTRMPPSYENFDAERHQRGLERPGVAALGAVREAARRRG